MVRSDPSPGHRLLRLWHRLERWPGGGWLFDRVLARMAPYTGTAGARVRRLEPGLCVASLQERRRVRNHLGSVHAVALLNLGELVSGLATLTALEPGVRGIVVGLEGRYRKKARGRLVATSRSRPGTVREPLEHRVRAEILDAAGEVVATVTATWRLAPPAEGS